MGSKPTKPRKMPKCPECKDNSNVVDIHSGYGTLYDTEHGSYVLSGVVINPEKPQCHCENCNIQFGRRHKSK